jgi:hypothetical protein
MKPILLLFLILLPNHAALASGRKLICTRHEFNVSMWKAREYASHDKYLHCAVSCMTSLRCYGTDVLVIGVIKEIGDIFGSGKPEREDLRANRRGVGLVSRGEARTDSQCIRGCDQFYPRH